MRGDPINLFNQFTLDMNRCSFMRSHEIFMSFYIILEVFYINVEKLLNAVDKVSISYHLQKLLDLDMYFKMRYIEWNFILIKISKEQKNEKK